MKTNEAPEKIFICDYGTEVSYEWHSESEFETKGPKDIEYTRKDVFIKKVIKYLHDNNKGFILTEKDIEDLRKYMED